MTEAETVALLSDLVVSRQPFLHVRFGDGDVFFATGTGPKHTADGEEWSPQLQERLRRAWRTLAKTRARLLVGDVESYAVSDGCEPQWRELRTEAEQLRGASLELVHIEALRAGRGFALPFYQAAAAARGPKLFVGPERLYGVAEMLGSRHLTVPLHRSHEEAQTVADAIIATPAEIVFFAAGRGGKIMQSILGEALLSLTQVDIGSGLDLLFGGVRRGTDRGVDVAAVAHEYQCAGLDVGSAW